ncbi:MAG TPA: N-methyl-L-tryptophan oxidase [Gemmataceae bacterium]|nr:N-methyl-L-tryptophan oxidase [Gemmataceae bacterium]
MGADRIFDVAVVGLGSMGSFACMELARRGAKVAGFDRFEPPHAFGSHSGSTRIYREAYAEGPDYVPLVKHAGRLWDAYGEEAGGPLLERCGMLSMGPPDSWVIAGVLSSATSQRVRVEQLNADEIRKRYPAFDPPGDHVGIFDPGAGWVDVDRALTFSLNAARSAGASICLDRLVNGWEAGGGSVRIRSEGETIYAGALVLAAGAWSAQLLPELPLSLERKVLLWVDPLDSAAFKLGRMPVFMFAEQSFYGLPDLGKGLKLAIDTKSGDALHSPSTMLPATDEDMAPVLRLAAKYLPRVGAPARVRDAKTCIYTMTPDWNFIIDRHPNHANVHFAAGFSGHGFKFAPAIGQALADLALTGRTSVPVEFLKIAGRFHDRVK